MSEQVRQVAPEAWTTEVTAARDAGFVHFDWLGAVDQIGRSESIEVLVRLLDPATVARAVLLRTEVPRNEPRLESIAPIFAGAGWHERESAELFAIEFVGGDPRRLLLPDDYAGAPLRKDAVLAARAGIDWPGVKEPGGAPSRRRMVPPGVPDPGVWGDRDPEAGEPEPDEVAASAAVGRVRSRRR